MVLVVGCAALISGGIDSATEEAQEHAITKSEYDSIDRGTSQESVEQQLGAPDTDQDFQAEGNAGQTCIYYNEEGAELFEGRYFQFCFDDGRLASKAAY